jgi:chromosome segregation ATPase
MSDWESRYSDLELAYNDYQAQSKEFESELEGELSTAQVQLKLVEGKYDKLLSQFNNEREEIKKKNQQNELQINGLLKDLSTHKQVLEQMKNKQRSYEGMIEQQDNRHRISQATINDLKEKLEETEELLILNKSEAEEKSELFNEAKEKLTEQIRNLQEKVELQENSLLSHNSSNSHPTSPTKSSFAAISSTMSPIRISLQPEILKLQGEVERLNNELAESVNRSEELSRDIAELSNDFDRLQDENQELRSTMKQLQSSSQSLPENTNQAELSQELANLTEQLNTANHSKSCIEEELNALKAKYNTVEAIESQLNTEINSLHEHIAQYKVQLSAVNNELIVLKEGEITLRNQSSTSNDQIQALEGNLKLANQQISSQATQFKSDMKTVQIKLEEFIKKSSATNNLLNQLQAEYNNVENELKLANDERKELHQQIVQSTVQLNQLQIKYNNSMQQLDQANFTIQTSQQQQNNNDNDHQSIAQSQITALHNKNNQLISDLANIQTNLSNKETDLTTLKHRCNSLEAERNELTHKNKAQQDTINSLQTELSKLTLLEHELNQVKAELTNSKADQIRVQSNLEGELLRIQQNWTSVQLELADKQAELQRIQRENEGLKSVQLAEQDKSSKKKLELDKRMSEMKSNITNKQQSAVIQLEEFKLDNNELNLKLQQSQAELAQAHATILRLQNQQIETFEHKAKSAAEEDNESNPVSDPDNPVTALTSSVKQLTQDPTNINRPELLHRIESESLSISLLVDSLQRSLTQVSEREQQFYSQLQELKGGNIRVYARIRPLLAKELKLLKESAEEKDSLSERVVEYPSLQQISLVHHSAENNANQTSTFAFDSVFPPDTSQQQVFDAVKEMINPVIIGHRACIFAYGQTGKKRRETARRLTRSTHCSY